jgi:K+-sensing histidine kinase KdpD
MVTAGVDTVVGGRSDWPGRHVALVWWAAVLLGPAAAGALTMARRYVASDHATLILVLVVAVVCVTGVRPAGLVAALTTALAYDYFWTEPYYRLVIFRGDDILTVMLLCLLGPGSSSWRGGRLSSGRLRIGGSGT